MFSRKINIHQNITISEAFLMSFQRSTMELFLLKLLTAETVKKSKIFDRILNNPLNLFVCLFICFFVSGRFNPLSTNPTKWSNTLNQFVGCCRRIISVCLTNFVGLAIKGLTKIVDSKELLSSS